MRPSPGREAYGLDPTPIMAATGFALSCHLTQNLINVLLLI